MSSIIRSSRICYLTCFFGCIGFNLLIAATSFAAGPQIVGTIDSDTPARVVLQQSSKNGSASFRSRRFSLSGGESGNRLTVVKNTGGSGGPVVFGIKTGKKVVSVSKARETGACSNTESRAVMAVKRKRRARRRDKRRVRLRGLSYDSDSSFAFPRSIANGQADSRTRFLARIKSNCAPSGARLGINEGETDENGLKIETSDQIAADGDGDGIADDVDFDDDNDGMPDAFDIDDDNDGVLDNDDTDSSNNLEEGRVNRRGFWVFSNFHLDMEESINANVMSVTKSLIDSALQNNAGLAFQVIGNGDLNVELDCGVLSYCSEGGTGQGKEPYPDGIEFPEDVDSDGDGFGTITPGSSGDFQLATNATSDELKAGDVYIQRVEQGKREIKVPGMLNFIFHTVPVVTRIVTSEQTYTPTYPVTSGDAGTPTNCFEVAASGDVDVALTVMRPQRPGISGAGESTFMDMGNLKLITNIPNGPCVTDGNGSCSSSSTGPGLCAGSVYTTSDSNLSVVSDGLQDSLGDLAASSTNTFTYSISLTDCLDNAGITWDSGETLQVPIQMMNVFGDNSAQNICFIRK